MSTTINVTVGGNGLLDQSRQQMQANRFSRLERDQDTKTETQATEDNRGRQPYQETHFFNQHRLQQQPAAFRSRKGAFGHLPGDGVEIVYDPDYPEKAIIRDNMKIDTRKYRAIKLGMPDSCPSYQSAGIEAWLFRNRTDELVSFVQAGGVLWVQSEWVYDNQEYGCGFLLSDINSFLQENFDASIRFGSGERYWYNRTGPNGEDANFLVYSAPGFRAPRFFYTDLCSPILGGTAMYSHPAVGTVVGFERIGKGFLVLSADSNATASLPVSIYSDDGPNFIDALLTLR